MTAEGRYAYAGSTGADIAVHDLACLVVHLHLFLGVVILSHLVNLRNYVVSQLMRELLDGLCLAGLHEFLVLLLEFCHRSCTCTRSTLIAGDVDSLDVGKVLDRLEHHYHHDCSTVRIGNDVARTVQCVLSIALRNHQRHIVTHAERT